MRGFGLYYRIGRGGRVLRTLPQTLSRRYLQAVHRAAPVSPVRLPAIANARCQRRLCGEGCWAWSTDAVVRAQSELDAEGTHEAGVEQRRC